MRHSDGRGGHFVEAAGRVGRLAWSVAITGLECTPWDDAHIQRTFAHFFCTSCGHALRQCDRTVVQTLLRVQTQLGT